MSKPRQQFSSLQSFASYLGHYRLRCSLVFISFSVSNIALAFVPVFIGKLTGVLAHSPVDSHQAFVYVWWLIGLSSFHDIIWRLSEYMYLRLLNPISYRYENIVFTEVIRKSYPYFVDKFTGKISSYIKTLGEEFKTLMENIFWDYADKGLSLIAACIILTAVNWQTGILFTCGIILMFIVGKHTIRNSAKYEQVWADVNSTKNGKIVDAIGNFVNIKSFRKEHRETLAFEQAQNKTIQAGNVSFKWNIVFWFSMSFFVREVIWPVTILFNVYLFVHHVISLADLTTFLTAVVLFTTYVWDLIWEVSQFNLKLARIEEAHTYLFGSINIVKVYYNRRIINDDKRAMHEKISLRRLDFAYPDKPNVKVLKAIDLELKKGEKIGIVGRSGSGKTTLTKLLLGYYPIDQDTLLLDDTPIATSELAKLISYVPQDTSLFHRTIAENIAYAADHGVSREEIIKAAKKAHADEFVTQLDATYDTLVGERGVKLSAGQRQRIAIARAFLDDKPILILDEATSALDSESEILVQQALEALWRDKTVIAIAHRLSTLRHMDRIIVIDKGRIIEQGSHAELLKHKGAYAKLWSHQLDGFIEE